MAQHKALFPFCKLSVDLQIAVFKQMPNLWTIISFRQTSREINELYLAHQKGILAALRNRLTAPFYDYYNFHVSLHLPEEAVIHPPPTGWPTLIHEPILKAKKSAFVLDVLRHLPYLTVDSFGAVHYIAPGSFVVDYYTQDKFNTPEKFGVLRGDSRHLIRVFEDHQCGAGLKVCLDTMTGIIHVHKPFRRRAQGQLTPTEFFARQKQRFWRLQGVFVPGHPSVPRPVQEPAWQPIDEESYDSDESDDTHKSYETDESGDTHESYETDESDETDFDSADLDNVESEDPPPYGENPVCYLDPKHVRWIRYLYRTFGWPGDGYCKEECMEEVRYFIMGD